MLPLQTLTLAVLCMLPLRWPHRTWAQISKDLLACPLCLCLHLITGMPPRLPLSAAIAYVLWVSIPGSFSSLTLPRHPEFMRTLVFADESDDGCKVCWDDKNRLAQLPCGHRCCEGCLQLMGQHSQTACPMCRAPLFSKRDRIMFVVSKGSVTISAVNLTIYSLRLLRDLQAGHLFHAGLTFGSMCPMAWYFYSMIGLCLTKGENWWRETAATTEPDAFELKMASFAFGSGVFIFIQTLWVTRGSFYA